MMDIERAKKVLEYAGLIQKQKIGVSPSETPSLVTSIVDLRTQLCGDLYDQGARERILAEVPEAQMVVAANLARQARRQSVKA